MIVLDANVVSEAMRPEPDPRVLAWLNAQSADTLHVSSVTLAELLFGLGVPTEGRRKARLTSALERLRALFSGRVVPFDEPAARLFADMAVRARAAGRPLAAADGYIAASAAARGLAVATRNVQDFSETGVDVVDPWQQA